MCATLFRLIYAYPLFIRLANKRDLRGAMTVKEVANAFQPICKGRFWHIVPTNLLVPMQQSGLFEALDWLIMAMDLCSNTKGPIPDLPETHLYFSDHIGNSPQDALKEKLEDFISRATKDHAEDIFIDLFRNYKLPSWDHYMQIRLTYIFLTTHGRQKGAHTSFTKFELLLIPEAQDRT